MEKGKWPDEKVLEQLIDSYKKNPQAGLMIHVYTSSEKSVSNEAMAKAAMALQGSDIEIAVDIFNGLLVMNGRLIKGAIELGHEKTVKEMGFKTFYRVLKDQGVKARVIKIKKNGSIKFIE